jgi:hypothetical protein
MLVLRVGRHFMNAARQAATKERFKPDLPKRLAALREKGGLKISFRFEKNLTVSSAGGCSRAALSGIRGANRSPCFNSVCGE